MIYNFDQSYAKVYSNWTSSYLEINFYKSYEEVLM